MKRIGVNTYTVSILMAGDLDAARATCRRYCMAGLCVTVEPVEFIYTGGSERGVRVGLINYPRFPASPEALWENALALANELRADLCQESFSLIAPDKTEWFSWRTADEARPEQTAGKPLGTSQTGDPL